MFYNNKSAPFEFYIIQILQLKRIIKNKSWLEPLHCSDAREHLLLRY